MYIARKVEYDVTGVPIAEIAVAGYATDVAFRRLFDAETTQTRRDETSSIDVVVILVPEGLVFARPVQTPRQHCPRCNLNRPSLDVWTVRHSGTSCIMLRFHCWYLFAVFRRSILTRHSLRTSLHVRSYGS